MTKSVDDPWVVSGKIVMTEHEKKNHTFEYSGDLTTDFRFCNEVGTAAAEFTGDGEGGLIVSSSLLNEGFMKLDKDKSVEFIGYLIKMVQCQD